jgi:hypothetical protein
MRVSWERGRDAAVLIGDGTSVGKITAGFHATPKTVLFVRPSGYHCGRGRDRLLDRGCYGDMGVLLFAGAPLLITVVALLSCGAVGVLWVYCGWLSLPFPPITARPGSTSGKVSGVRRSIYLTYLGPQASTYTETIPEIMDVNILLWRHLRPAVYYYHYYYSNPDG